jgi:hypothetical protein
MINIFQGRKVKDACQRSNVIGVGQERKVIYVNY